MESLLDEFVEFVGAQVTSEQPHDQLRQFVIGHVTWKLEQRDAAGAYTSSLGMRDIVHELPEDHQSILIERQRRHLDRLRQILTTGMKAGEFTIDEINVTAFAIVTMCEYVVAWYSPDGAFSPAEIAEKYADLAQSMVTGPTPHKPSTKPRKGAAKKRT